jgi:ABC-type branched-subunit amino acid transport system ATPase component
MTDTQPLLHCENVTRRFGSLVAVDHMTVNVAKGEILGIGGPNGAGKTTFFDVITGITPASDGRIIFDGQDVTTLGADRACQMGMARTFQLNAAFDHMTVLENVEIAAYYGRRARFLPGLRLGAATKHAAWEALDLVGLSHKAGMTVADLPVLDRKLLMIAGAMATEPQMLFLDEPVGGLNAEEIDFVMDLVKRLAEGGLTIVLIEHVMRFLLALSSRVIIMHHGAQLFEGPPHAVAENDDVVEVYLGQGTKDRLKKHFGLSAGAVA